MPPKSIVCVFGGHAFEASALDAAFALKVRFAARLRVLHPVISPLLGALGDASLMADWSGVVQRENDRQRAIARDALAAAAARHDLAVSDAPGADVAFGAVEDIETFRIGREVGLADLIVVGIRPDSTAELVDRPVPNTALFSSRRPVLVVRSGSSFEGALDKPCAVAWNGRSEAIHALVEAMPLIAAAGSARVFTTSDQRESLGPDGERLPLDYLAAHGVAAEHAVIDREGQSAAEAVLEHAHRAGCGVIVMGAYGHSVFRETLLGGFSVTMLRRSDLPLVMCH